MHVLTGSSLSSCAQVKLELFGFPAECGFRLIELQVVRSATGKKALEGLLKPHAKARRLKAKDPRPFLPEPPADYSSPGWHVQLPRCPTSAACACAPPACTQAPAPVLCRLASQQAPPRPQLQPLLRRLPHPPPRQLPRSLLRPPTPPPPRRLAMVSSPRHPRGHPRVPRRRPHRTRAIHSSTVLVRAFCPILPCVHAAHTVIYLEVVRTHD